MLPFAPTTCTSGLFLALKRLSKDNGPVPAAQASGARGRKQNKDMKGKSDSYVTARAIEAHGNVQMSHDLQVTLRVLMKANQLMLETCVFFVLLFVGGLSCQCWQGHGKWNVTICWNCQICARVILHILCVCLSQSLFSLAFSFSLSLFLARIQTKTFCLCSALHVFLLACQY